MSYICFLSEAHILKPFICILLIGISIINKRTTSLPNLSFPDLSLLSKEIKQAIKTETWPINDQPCRTRVD